MSTNTLTVVIDLPFLAAEVNDAHKQVTFHARSLLLEAKRAGEALIAAKKSVKHGEFKAWVEANCRCSYRTAAKYMAVAKSKCADLGIFEGGVDAFLEAHSKPRKEVPKAVQVMDATDADYILKLHAMVERASPNERAVAARKLADKAQKDFGLSPNEAVAEAQRLLPDSDKSTRQREMEQAEAKLKAAEDRLATLEAQLESMIARKAEIKQELYPCTREELIDRLADAYLHMEQTA